MFLKVLKNKLTAKKEQREYSSLFQKVFLPFFFFCEEWEIIKELKKKKTFMPTIESHFLSNSFSVSESCAVTLGERKV